MARLSLEIAIFSILASALVTASHLIPFNLPALILYGPLAELVPALGRTGDAVEIGFMWITVKEAWVWVVLFVYHFFVIYVVTTLVMLWRNRP